MSEPAGPDSAALRGARILLVDDEPAIRRSLGVFLERRGARVAAASGTAEAAAALAAGAYDLVITDVSMPGGSGVQLMRQVKQRWPALPVILMTGSLESSAAAGALDGTADAYLLKPFDLSELGRTAARVLARGRGPEEPHGR